MKSLTAGLVFLVMAALTALTNPSLAGKPEGDDSAVATKVRKSVASLVGYAGGNEFRATGFVVARPSDGKKIILTAGHIFREEMVLWARFPGMSKPVECELVAVSSKHDLMAIVPREPITAAPLPLLPAKGPQPRLDDPVFLVGCPGGLDWTQFKGEINAEPITADDLQKMLGTPDLKAKKTPNGDALLLRHSSFSFPGMSGCPVLDRRGNVIGVQIGTLPKASNVSFAIHTKHVADLDLGAKPRPFEGGPNLESEIGNVLTTTVKTDRPLLLRIGGEDVDGRCLHFGYVTKDADKVIARYVQDQKWFLKFFTKERLQTLLDRTSVAHITNPTLGFRVLVPKGYSYTVGPNKTNSGVLVTFVSPDEGVPAPYNSVTIRAYVDSMNYALSALEADKMIAAGQLPFPKGIKDTPFAREVRRRSAVDVKMLSLAERVFPSTLKIRLVDDEDRMIAGNPQGPTYRRCEPYSSADPTTACDRYHYESTTGENCHDVQFFIRDKVIVIVDYQFRKKDMENFRNGKEVSRAFLERAFIAATVSLY